MSAGFGSQCIWEQWDACKGGAQPESHLADRHMACLSGLLRCQLCCTRWALYAFCLGRLNQRPSLSAQSVKRLLRLRLS